jgi:flagellar motor switch protein FliN
MADARILLDALATNLGAAVSAMTGSAVRSMPTVGEATVDWQVPVQVSGAAAGTVWLGMSQADATLLVASILGDPSLVADADIVDTMKELLGQAASAHVHGRGKGLDLTVEAPAPAAAPGLQDAQQYDLMMGTGDPIRIVGWGRILATRSHDPSRSAMPVGSSAPPPASLAAPSAAAAPRNLDVVLDIELPITVRFGETQMTLEGLARLGPGSMIDLARSPEDPVDLLVNGRLVARGEVVVVSGCYGLRVSEVVSPADRLRSLEL